ncbi:MAG: type II secretion system F family protein [Acidimicrobiales bacterium]
MPIVVWLGALALASSAPVAWWALSGGDRVNRRVVSNLANQELTLRAADLDRSALERITLPLARSLGRRALRYTPVGWAAAKSATVAKAGLTGRITAEQVLGAKILATLVVGCLLVIRLSNNPSPGSAVVTVAATVTAFLAPDLLLRARADRRVDEITRALPDLLDQLTMSVEAGLGFEAALTRIVRTDDGALAQEIGRTLQDILLGAWRMDALADLAQRSQVGDLNAVVVTLRQSESLGTPLARTLRLLATEMREKRRFRAEERANQLPIKMMFPLGLCILPALFVVILGPAVIRYLEVF